MRSLPSPVSSVVCSCRRGQRQQVVYASAGARMSGNKRFSVSDGVGGQFPWLQTEGDQVRMAVAQLFLVEYFRDGKHRIELEHLASDAAFLHVYEDVCVTDEQPLRHLACSVLVGIVTVACAAVRLPWIR